MKIQSYKFSLGLFLFLFFFLSGAQEAKAHCYCNTGADSCFWWQWECDGFDQTLGEVNMSYDPRNQETLRKNEQTFECGSTDPVDLSNGQFTYNCQGLQVPGRKLDLETTHTYNSGTSFNGPFGYGWMPNFYMRLHTTRAGNAIIVAGNGRRLEYTQNGGVYQPPAGRFETLVKNPDGSWTLTLSHGEQYQFDPDGKLISIEDRNDNTISFTYSATREPYYGQSQFGQNPANTIAIGMDYRLEQITDTTGRIINLTYNDDGLLETIVDGLRSFTFNYDSLTNDLLSVTKPATTQFPAGVTKTFVYDPDHNVTHVTDAKGQTFVENIYDSQGRVEEQILGGHSILLDYSVPNQTTETDRNGNRTVYTFDPNGQVIEKEVLTRGFHPGEPVSYTITFTYNGDFLTASETFPKGNGVKYVYDELNSGRRARGNLLEARRKADMAIADNDTNDIVTRLTYDPNFNLIKTAADPKGNVTTTLYDYELNPIDPRYGEGGNPVTITFPEVAAGIPEVNFVYNEYGQPVEIMDPNGNVTQYEYFPITGYLQRIIEDPAGINAITQLTYDSFGNLDTITDANNHTTNLDFNELNWLIKETDALGQETNYRYDANGNLIKEERTSPYIQPSPAISYTYTAMNKIQTITDELGHVTTLGYDFNDNQASVTDANGKITTSNYDERNLLWKVTDANSPAGITEYAYDPNGNLAQIKDASGNPTNYLYDGFDREERMTYADSSFSQYGYDKNSNIISHRTPSSEVIDYVYDALNRPTSKTSVQDPSINTTFDYDLGSRLTSASRPSSVISHQYDALNRIFQTTQTLTPNPYTLNYQYDKAGNRTQVTYPDGTVYHYSYDAADRMDKIQDSTLKTLVDYDYHAERRLRSLRKYPKVFTAYEYDRAKRLTSVSNEYFSHLRWPDSTDRDNQPPPATKNNILKRFLALMDRLLSPKEAFAKSYGPYSVFVTLSRFTYILDNIGNRIRAITGLNGITNGPWGTFRDVNYAYNDIYELTNVTGSQTHNYQYDGVGNRTTADGVAYTPNNLNQYNQVNSQVYSYDGNGNLTDDGPNGYTYDVENRLTSAQNVSHNSTYAYDGLGRRISKTVDGSTTYFVYDGDQIIEERNSAGTLLASYLYGEGIDEIITMKRGPTTYWYLQDGLGSTTDIIDETGRIVYERYQYDPYGNVTIKNGSGATIPTSAIGNRYMFTGREFDEESGQYHYRERTYSPLIGRFQQRDPIGFYDSMNLFEYAFNSPVNWIDPWGEQFFASNPPPPMLPPASPPSSTPEYDTTTLPNFPSGNICMVKGGHEEKAQSTGRGRTKDKHEKGEARRKKDRGGEKGDARREPRGKRPPGHKGSWP